MSASTVSATALGKVGVLLGGRSSERDVSLLSGAAVLRALRASGVDAHPFDPAQQSLAQLEAAAFDRVFLILHGRYGEDGAMQGVLETLRIPYTGSGVQASAIAIDKILTKRIWQAEGIPTPAWVRHDRGADAAPAAMPHAAPAPQLPSPLAQPDTDLVVKPASEGSTFGVTKVAAGDRAALAVALAEALRFDAHVLIEECIHGRELTCAVLGQGASARALPLVEIRAPGANYDYHNKYFSDATQYLCPAPLDEALARHISALCVRAYRAVGARGWGRVDVMLREAAGGAEPYLLEINTAPGMTDHSLVPMAARAAGLGFADLVLQILADARVEIGMGAGA
jgi:D-alanine-D-alanine ligase